MKMNKYFSAIILGTALVGMSACEPQTDPLENEQYKKEVYLVGAAQDIQDKEISYAGDGSLYVSAAIGGTQFPDQDVTVTLGLADNAKMASYNYKNFSDADVKYQPLPADWYNFPSWTGTIKAGDVYCRIPLTVNTEKIHPDSLYVIPLKIVSTSAYSIVKTDTTLLVHPKMVNDYSGAYTFEGTTWQMKNGEKDINSASSTTTIRNATALNASTIRLYQKVIAEKVANVAANCYNIRVNADNTLTVTAYDKLAITDGGGKYDPDKGIFTFWYTYTEGGKEYRTEATLTKSK